MGKSLEKRFQLLQRQVEGFREKTQYEEGMVETIEKVHRILTVQGWRKRIMAELDFCLQMKAHAGTDVEKPVDKALSILENALSVEGVLTDAACEKAEQCLLPLQTEAHTYTMLMAGHAHLDMNWQWGFDETVATVIATFRTMLKLLEEYPDFHFSQSQASAYKIIEDYAPEMKADIQRRIKEGRWEVTASAWVETDKNLPCLESLMNHIVYTKQYLKEHWEIEPETLDIDFSPDTFGHSAFLPELDTLGGIKYYYHCRGLGELENVLYRWKAPSGNELLMYREPYWYNGGISPEKIVGLPHIASLCGGLRTGLLVYGVGDHGGGPTRRDLNHALEMMEWPIFPRLRFARIHDYFEAAESVRDNIPLVEHELNCVFTGCYTTQSRIKKGNRRAEKTLLNAEKLSALTSDSMGEVYPYRSFEKAWQNTLFTHFHDILTGSCVQDAREHAMGLYQEALSVANSRAARALEVLGQAIDTSQIVIEDDKDSRSEGAGVGFGVTQGNIPTHENGMGMTRILHIVNTTGVDRHENATLTVWDWPGDLKLLEVTDVEGHVLPFECTTGWKNYWSHRYFDVMVTVKVPANGYTTVVLKEKEPTQVTGNYMFNDMTWYKHEPKEDFVLENEYICVKFDGRSGEMISLVDKVCDCERIRSQETGGLRYIRTQRDNMGSWIIGRYLELKKLSDVTEINPMNGRLYSGFTAVYAIENSQVTMTVTLGHKDKFVKVQLHVDWKEDTKERTQQPLLSYYVPLKDTAGRLLCDVPGGVVWRPDQELDVPCQRYGAAEFEDGRVLALASDCKYGFRLSRGDLFVTLINTADCPDKYPERGIQDITLFIMPSVADAKVLAEETDICVNPLQYMTNTSHGGTLPTTGSMLRTEGETVVFTGVAQREDYLTIRMYEAQGESCPVTVVLQRDIAEAKVTDLFGNELNIFTTVKGCAVSFVLAAYSQVELRVK